MTKKNYYLRAYNNFKPILKIQNRFTIFKF